MPKSYRDPFARDTFAELGLSLKKLLELYDMVLYGEIQLDRDSWLALLNQCERNVVLLDPPDVGIIYG